MSASILEPIPVERTALGGGLNLACVLRRNVRTQPYGRCTVCTLHLKQCHAWQSNGYSFGVIVLALAALLAPPGVLEGVAVGGILLLVVVQGIVHHQRTDELIFGQHKLLELQRDIATKNGELEREVQQRTVELRERNLELASTNLELIELDRVRTILLANVSHELRTPLTSIRGAAQNMKDGVIGPLTSSQLEYVDIVEGESGRLVSLVNQLLESTKLEHGRVSLSRSDVDLVALAEDVVRPLRSAAELRRVVVDVSGTAPVVSADGPKVQQIVGNLVDNALKFTNEGGRVAVRVRATPEGAAIDVEDDGIGIDPDDAAMIFERFFRSRRAADRPGTGLGLTIARNLARLHGGELTVRSQPGAGSAFTLALPRHAGEAVVARRPRLLPILEA